MKKNLTLVIGDKNLSSWSMRPWLVMKESGLPFREVQVLLDRPDTDKKLAKVSPSKRVPVFIYKNTPIWDSLAICETLAELAPDKNLWPTSPRVRAEARSCVAEMHSSFSSLRSQLSMDIQLRTKLRHLLPSTCADIKRVLSIWKSCLKKYKGPFLFGDFSIADAFYAPVVMRFRSYQIEISDPAIQRYMSAVEKRPSVAAWIKAAKKEKPYYVRF